MPKRTHTPVSEGQRRLLELRLSQRQIGDACGVSHATIQRWLSGAKAPVYEHRLKLQELFGIERQSWDMVPEPQTLAESLASALRTQADAIVTVEAAKADKALPDAVEGLEELIQQCRSARAVPDVAPTILARIGAIEVRAIAERERLRSAIELACKHPDVAAWGEELGEQIRPHVLAYLDLMLHDLKGRATPERVADWSKAYADWRARHWELVELYERANAGLRAALPEGARFDTMPATSAPRAAA
jgi:transcriptional regulator with XRE-family HTH domain